MTSQPFPRLLAPALVMTAAGLTGCAVEPNDTNLKDSFVAQIESVGGVSGLIRNGDTLTFSGQGERFANRPWGLFGGEDGGCGSFELRGKEGRRAPLPIDG